MKVRCNDRSSFVSKTFPVFPPFPGAFTEYQQREKFCVVESSERNKSSKINTSNGAHAHKFSFDFARNRAMKVEKKCLHADSNSIFF
jgi:hypothetical protein